MSLANTDKYVIPIQVKYVIEKNKLVYTKKVSVAFFFKSPMVGEGLYPKNDLFTQRDKMENEIRYLINE